MLLVTGASQVGKTTLLQHICRNDQGYVTLDDPLVLSLARQDPALFMQIIRAASARTAQILNLSELARDADIAPNTAKSWLSILQASDIVYLLEPYHTNGD